MRTAISVAADDPLPQEWQDFVPGALCALQPEQNMVSTPSYVLWSLC